MIKGDGLLKNQRPNCDTTEYFENAFTYTTEQLADLSERLTGVIKTWLEETHNEPDFFNIIGEKEISICNIAQ